MLGLAMRRGHLLAFVLALMLGECTSTPPSTSCPTRNPSGRFSCWGSGGRVFGMRGTSRHPRRGVVGSEGAGGLQGGAGGAVASTLRVGLRGLARLLRGRVGGGRGRRNGPRDGRTAARPSPRKHTARGEAIPSQALSVVRASNLSEIWGG